uniref:Uncharacterized protein n=1 Tax=Panagrolaimus superbus TaxID=310955 RepID=A0A914Y7R6_9BILA
MVETINFCQLEYCPTHRKTVIEFGENLEFTVSYDRCKVFRINNIKGDLEITKITRDKDGREIEVKYENNAFYSEESADFTFYITAKIEPEELCDDENDIQIDIKNSYDVIIKGKEMKKDAVLKANPKMDANLNLSFRFNPNVYHPTVYTDSVSQILPLNESRPESIIPSYLSNENSKLFKNCFQ